MPSRRQIKFNPAVNDEKHMEIAESRQKQCVPLPSEELVRLEALKGTPKAQLKEMGAPPLNLVPPFLLL